MKEVILIKVGELILKGLNKKTFENYLIKDIKRRISQHGKYKIKNSQSTISIESVDENSNINDILPIISKIFGITKFSKAFKTNKDIKEIEKTVLSCLDSTLNSVSSFKVESKRSDKKFYMTSPQISEEVGAYILQEFPHLKVDVHNPDIIVTIEIRDFGAYISANFEKGMCGLPSGSSGKAAVLISGGIDSPVASFMMSKRGLKLIAIHFSSPPYTSIRAQKKVIDLLEKVSEYSGQIKLFIVPFTNIQEEIKKSCPEDLSTLITRRMMMKISENIAINQGCKAIITGESLGQVASQTLSALFCTNEGISVPILRPLIGMDKDEIIDIARKISTFEISIRPFEDCCTIFTPKHPRTNPHLSHIKNAEERVCWDDLINNAVEHVKIMNIGE